MKFPDIIMKTKNERNVTNFRIRNVTFIFQNFVIFLNNIQNF